MPALTKYKITAVNRYGQAMLSPRVAKGYANIKETKRDIRNKLNKKRQSFDVYNESKRKFL